jgi:hypothetical protein
MDGRRTRSPWRRRQIQVAIDISAPPSVVWADVRQLSSHVEWMQDATAIRFTSDAGEGVGVDAREGVGVRFDCDTRIGPLRLTDKMDKMVVTEWEEERTIGIRHEGLVTGRGRFTLTPGPGQTTRFAWTEELTFPWWLGGPVGAVVGGLVLRAVWNRNLVNLRARFG